MIKKLFLLLVLLDFALVDCNYDYEQEGNDKSQAMKYKVGAIVSILVAGAIGVFIPILGRSSYSGSVSK